MPHVGGKRPGSSGAQRTTTRLLVFFALGALAAGLSSVFVPCATASPGTIVAGSYAETVDDVTVRYEGGKVIADFTATVQLTGGFTGIGTSVGTQIIYPTGALTVQAVVVCTCTVDGEVGELVLRFTAIGLYPVAKVGLFEVSGTGGLANLHGHGTFQQGNLEGTYEAYIYFDP